MQTAELSLNDTVRVLARKIARYEELLKLLSSLGDTLREAGGGERDDEVDAVRRSWDALMAVLAPHKCAFYCAKRGDPTETFLLMKPGRVPQFPKTIGELKGRPKNSLEPISLADDVVGLAYWHLPTVGRRWALVVLPTETGYIDPTASFSVKLFGDILAGISSARTLAEQRSLEEALLRLLDEQKVVLSVEAEELRQSARDVHLELQDLEKILEDRGIPKKEIARILQKVYAARDKLKKGVTELSKSIQGLRPGCLGVREQLESEREAQLAEILGNLPDVHWDGVDHATAVRTRPATLSQAIQFFQGELCELIRADLPLAWDAPTAAAIPVPRVRRDSSGGLHIDLACHPPKLDAKSRDEFRGLLRQLVATDMSGEAELSRFQPLACRSLVYYLKKELQIAVSVHNDGLRLTIPKNRVHWPRRPVRGGS